MAKLPEYVAKEIIQNTGIIRPGNTGEGLADFGRGLGSIGAHLNAEAERDRLVAERAYIADVEVRNRERLVEIFAANNTSPDRVKSLSEAHIEGVLQGVPENLRTRIAPALKETATSLYARSLTADAERGRAVQLDSLQSNRKFYASQILDLSSRGLGGTEQAAAAKQRYEEAGQALVDGKFLSRDHVRAEFADLEDSSNGQTMLAFNRETLKRFGYASAWSELNEFFGDKSQIGNPKIRAQLLNQGQEYLREQVSAQDKIQTIADRAVKLREEDTAKTMVELGAKNKLTLDWVLANRGNLSKADFHSGVTAMTKPDAVKDDLPIFDSLDRRMRDGEDVTSEIVAAQDSGYLKHETARTMILKNRELLSAAGPKNAYRVAEDNLKDAFAVSPLVQDPAAHQRKADAMEMFRRQFTEENERRRSENKPPMSDPEIFLLRDEVKQRFQFVAWDQLSVSMPLPKYFVGTRNNPNLDATEQAIVKAYRSGELTDSQIRREAEILKRWRDAVAKRPKVGPKKNEQ